MEQQIITMLITFGVPYVTTILKNAYALFSPNAPAWLTKLKPILAGLGLNYLSMKTGMPVPPDLVHLTNDPAVNYIATGIGFGTVGHWLSSFADGLKAHIPSSTAVGKFLSVFLGKY